MRSLLRTVLLLSTTLLALPLGATAFGQDKPTIKMLMIGYPDADNVDAVSGATVPGVQHLQDAFNAANPTINLEIISIPWGEGATSYSAKTEAMITANEACIYDMPAAPRLWPPRHAGQPRRHDRRRQGLQERLGRPAGGRALLGAGQSQEPVLHPVQHRRARHPLGRQAVRGLGRRAAEQAADARRDRGEGAEADGHQSQDRGAELRLLVPGQVRRVAVHGHRPRHGRRLGQRRREGPAHGELGHAGISRGARNGW